MIIVGLGNPGRRYDGTRHNVGRDAVVRLARSWNLESGKNRFSSQVVEGVVAGRRCVLSLPETFMNRSGDAVAPLMGFYKYDPESVVVVHDELDLEPGAVRVKKGGGHGGHNGVRDIIRALGTREFLRVRLGIGRPPQHVEPASFVLMKWRADEESTVEDMKARAVEALELLLRDGPVAAMNQFNVRTNKGKTPDSLEKETT